MFSDGIRGKQWSVVSKFNQKDFNFLTVIYPFRGYNNRLDEEAKKISINNWKINTSEWEIKGDNSTSLNSEKGTYVFNAKELKNHRLTLKSFQEMDLFITTTDNKFFIYSIGTKPQTISVIFGKSNKQKINKLEPEAYWVIDL